MLGLERQSGAVFVDVPRLTGDAPIEEVPGVELNPWLGRDYVQRPATPRFGKVCRVH